MTKLLRQIAVREAAILQQCTYETAAIVAPGTAITTYWTSGNIISATKAISLAYFFSCEAKHNTKALYEYFVPEEVQDTQISNFAETMITGTAAGKAFADSGLLGIVPSVVMSLGYGFTFTYEGIQEISIGIFLSELITALIDPGNNALDGAKSGLVFVGINFLETAATQYLNSDDTNADFDTHSVNATLALQDQCPIGENSHNEL